MRRIVVLLIALISIISGCASPNSIPDLTLDDPRFDGYDPVKSIYYNLDSGIRFRVSPMIEATYLAVEMANSGNDFTNYQDNTPYIEAGKERFKDFQDHEFVKMLSSMMIRGYTYDAIPSSIYHFNENFKLRNDIEINEFTMKRSSGQENLEKLMIYQKAFRMDSDFDSYFRDNKEQYIKMMDKGHYIVNSYNVEEVVEDFYGKPIQNSIITVTPHAKNAYGVSIDLKTGSLEVLPTLGVYDDEEIFINVLVHEISHTYVNPLTAQQGEILEETEDLYGPLKNVMSNQAYTTWETTVNEHIVRANTAIMLKNILGETAYKNALAKDRERGFKYIYEIVEAVCHYTENRDEFPTFEDYHPEIMKVFLNLK
ncbi:DUF4932 domain-containing protein [Gudongella sp. DL1XJH-153]|uniref:DUF4932 domain-containing protein n=1 Tax=Gudongella sp. DL1XJH-153 TaxID=3409804 RepID=UPI003BB6EFF5